MNQKTEGTQKKNRYETPTNQETQGQKGESEKGRRRQPCERKREKEGERSGKSPT